MFDPAATRRALERMESYCAAPNWNIKTKLIIIIGLLATANSSHATLIDLTPGGFHEGDLSPVFVNLILHNSQIAGANIDGNSVHWSQFEPFGSNEFSIIPLGPNALISWDLSLTDGYMFQYLLLEGVNDQANIYRVPGAQFIDGTAYVTVDNFSMIQAIIFYGTNVVAETVNTGWLLFFAVVGLLLRYKLRQRRIA
jgi:hypothetical protein